MKLENGVIKVILLAAVIPVLLIPNLPFLLLLSDVILPLFSACIYGLNQLIVPIVIAILINFSCMKYSLNRWFGFAWYMLEMIPSIGIGMLWVYLLFKDAAHPMAFSAYLWMSWACILFHLVLYLIFMLVFRLLKKK